MNDCNKHIGPIPREIDPCPMCGETPEPFLHPCMGGGSVWRIHHECEDLNRTVEVEVGGSLQDTRWSVITGWNRRHT